MFSGIIEKFATVEELNIGKESCLITLSSPLGKELVPGSSIAVNGVCLTVVKKSGESFSLDVMPETVNKTDLSKLSVGSKVNLERPLGANGRFEGHIVQGHVDGTGTIIEIKEVENAHEIRIKTLEKIMKLCVEKGSVAIDGISMTLIEVGKDNFTISVIPYTSQHTTLGFKKIGDLVNLEVDVLGKYVYKYLTDLAINPKLRENNNT